MITAEKIVTMGQDVLTNVREGEGARQARARLVLGFAELKDRTAACEAACAILDDLKAARKVGKTVTGQKVITVVVAGIEKTTTTDVKNDTTSNAKRLLASCVNNAYQGYNDKVTLVSEKVGPTTYKLTEAKQIDKVAVAFDRLVALLDITQPEEESLRASITRMAEKAAMDKLHAEALAENAKIDHYRAVALEKEKAEAFKRAQLSAKIADICAAKGLKVGTKAYAQTEEILREALAM